MPTPSCAWPRTRLPACDQPQKIAADAVRAHLEIAKRLLETQEEISAVNLELLSRRELD